MDLNEVGEKEDRERDRRVGGRDRTHSGVHKLKK